MAMKTRTLIIATILAIAALAACLNTLTTPKYSAVTIKVHAGRAASLSAEPLTLVKRLEFLAADLLSPEAAQAYIPSLIANVRLTVTAADMETLRKTEPAGGLDSVTLQVQVPIGPARNFLVEGLDGASAAIYSGQALVDLTGAPVTVPIAMVPGAVS